MKCSNVIIEEVMIMKDFKHETKTCTCIICGKTYEFPDIDLNNVSPIIKKQAALQMCDKCYKQYLKDQEDQE